jgi:hypothetical protein
MVEEELIIKITREIEIITDRRKKERNEERLSLSWVRMCSLPAHANPLRRHIHPLRAYAIIWLFASLVLC